MKTARNPLFKMLILAAIAFAKIASANDFPSSSEMDRIVDALGPLLSSLSPPPKLERDTPSSMKLSHRARIYRIHGLSMTGEYDREAKEEAGPDASGFILCLNLQGNGLINQVDTPQTLLRPYWKTYIQTTPVAYSDRQLYWSLSYGSRTDKKILSQIRRAIEKAANAIPP